VATTSAGPYDAAKHERPVAIRHEAEVNTVEAMLKKHREHPTRLAAGGMLGVHGARHDLECAGQLCTQSDPRAAVA
jgi:hypothetical protein